MNGIKTIFFAHDHQENPSARVNYLEHAGYRVRTFPTAQSLVTAFQEEEPACVVMDVLLEGRNGFVLASDIQRVLPDRSFPMILCTRLYGARRFHEEAQRCGVSAYLQMPMSPEEFLNHVNYAIQTFEPARSGKLDLKT